MGISLGKYSADESKMHLVQFANPNGSQSVNTSNFNDMIPDMICKHEFFRITSIGSFEIFFFRRLAVDDGINSSRCGNSTEKTE